MDCPKKNLRRLSGRKDGRDCLLLGRLTSSLLSALLLLVWTGSGAVTWLVAQEAIAAWADIPCWRGLSGACAGLVLRCGR